MTPKCSSIIEEKQRKIWAPNSHWQESFSRESFFPRHISVVLPVKKLVGPAVWYQISPLTHPTAILDAPLLHLSSAYRRCGSSCRLHMPPAPAKSRHRQLLPLVPHKTCCRLAGNKHPIPPSSTSPIPDKIGKDLCPHFQREREPTWVEVDCLSLIIALGRTSTTRTSSAGLLQEIKTMGYLLPECIAVWIRWLIC
jgi:hypothetical protein